MANDEKPLSVVGPSLRAKWRVMLRLFRSPPPMPTGATSIAVDHGGEQFRVAVKRVGRARRFTLRVRAATGEAVLTMPPGGSLRAARVFAERNAAWIGERLHRLPDKIVLGVGSMVPLRGVEIPIVEGEGLRKAAWLRAADDGSAAIVVAGTPEEQHARVLDLLRREARHDIEAAVQRHAAAVGKPVRRITLRDTRSRWGSCTAQGALNFSWRLILAPPHVLDYLAAHEVAHLVHMDHSPAFWAVTARLDPDLDRAEAWLKASGPTLHRYG
jgi:predicted metal-dependent hydrolase